MSFSNEHVPTDGLAVTNVVVVVGAVVEVDVEVVAAAWFTPEFP
jgi:hypothetical protein